MQLSRDYGRTRFRRIAATALFAYASLVMQPCAMAMGEPAVSHPPRCPEKAAEPDANRCLVQSIADCTSTNPVLDSRDPAAPKFTGELPFLGMAFEPVIRTAGSLAYPGRGQIRVAGAAALHVINCVFLM